MSAKRGILVVGMHGKTTTSAMTGARLTRRQFASVALCRRRDPDSRDITQHWDARGEFFVAEGDESDGTIALFHPEHALVLNIEEEHLDFYADLAAIEKGLCPTDRRQTSGKIFYCADDPTRRAYACPP